MAFELIVIGGSWGGMRALTTVLDALPADFELPLVVAQHRPVTTGDELLEHVLARSSKLPVVGATDKEPIEPGRVYVAPADYHLLVEPGHLALSADAPVEFSRPSIDVLFESAADVYGKGLLGIILTGWNQDGADGLQAVHRAGGLTIVQNPDTAEAPVMPQAALARTAVDYILNLEEIAALLAALPAGKRT